MNTVCLEETTSTMEEARLLLEHGKVKPRGAVLLVPEAICAKTQTAGRGQRGRRWESPPGSSLYATILFRRGFTQPENAWLLSFLAGAAAAEALYLAVSESVGIPAPRSLPRIGLKWPNDILLNGTKAGGILIELRSASALGTVALIGAGINLGRAELPPDLAGRATSLMQEGGPEINPLRLLQWVRHSLHRIADLHKNAGTAAVMRRWRQWDETSGRIFETVQQGQLLRGTAEGVLDDGRLQLRLDGGHILSTSSASSLIERQGPARH